MRCLSCKYDLSKTPEPRCPECGRTFDPEDASTFKTCDTITTATVMGPIAVIAGLVLFAIGIEVWIRWRTGDLWRRPWMTIAILIVIGLGTCAVFHLWRLRQRRS